MLPFVLATLFAFSVSLVLLVPCSRMINRFFKSATWRKYSAGLCAWTPLINTTDFDGIRTDITTVSVGIISILLIIVGIGLLVKVLGR